MQPAQELAEQLVKQPTEDYYRCVRTTHRSVLNMTKADEPPGANPAAFWFLGRDGCGHLSPAPGAPRESGVAYLRMASYVMANAL